jgi:hypothetical protein
MGWRYQIPLLLDMGFRVVAPDMMGYGGTVSKIIHLVIGCTMTACRHCGACTRHAVEYRHTDVTQDMKSGPVS